jgi:nucleotide-binding universal stress UspA family protein
MKAVVGIDLEGHYVSVLSLLSRLNFALDETALLHVNEPIATAMPYSAYGALTETEEILEAQKKAAEESLDLAEKFASERGLVAKKLVAEGFPAQEMVDYGAEIQADLLAVTSTVTGTFDAVLGGSIARGLAISAKHSVLVARNTGESSGPVTAVFAVDASPYCEQCVEQLAAFAPKGLSHVTLLTVKESTGHGINALTEGALKEYDEILAGLLKDAGISTSVEVVTGRLEDSIHRVMEETGADLLILGSQSHGILDRLLEGSTALHEVIHEKYPVLLVRP